MGLSKSIMGLRFALGQSAYRSPPRPMRGWLVDACFPLYKPACWAEYNQLFNLFLACETAAEDLGERGKYLLHCWIVRTATYASSRHFDRCVTAWHLVPSRVTCRLFVTFLGGQLSGTFPLLRHLPSTTSFAVVLSTILRSVSTSILSWPTLVFL